MNTWKLTSFDQFSLGMTIKGAWIYKDLPQTSALQASLDAVLRPYPQLLGRYDEKRKSVFWNGREEPIRLVELERGGHSVSEDMYTLVPDADTLAKEQTLSRVQELGWSRDECRPVPLRRRQTSGEASCKGEILPSRGG